MCQPRRWLQDWSWRKRHRLSSRLNGKGNCCGGWRGARSYASVDAAKANTRVVRVDKRQEFFPTRVRGRTQRTGFYCCSRCEARCPEQGHAQSDTQPRLALRLLPSFHSHSSNSHEPFEFQWFHADAHAISLCQVLHVSRCSHAQAAKAIFVLGEASAGQCLREPDRLPPTHVRLGWGGGDRGGVCYLRRNIGCRDNRWLHGLRLLRLVGLRLRVDPFRPAMRNA